MVKEFNTVTPTPTAIIVFYPCTRFIADGSGFKFERNDDKGGGAGVFIGFVPFLQRTVFLVGGIVMQGQQHFSLLNPGYIGNGEA